MPNITDITQEILQKVKNLSLPPDAAGRKSTTKVPIATHAQTIEEVRSLLFEKVPQLDTINYIYVVSESGRLNGVISIKDIFRSAPGTKVSEIMIKKLVKAHPSSDQEKVAHTALKAGIKAIPIVDDRGYFLGVVDSDEIQKILDHESKEDLLRISGIIGKHESAVTAPIFSSLKSRAPWIIIGLLGGLITASTIGSFQKVLQKNLVLASFIPLIAYIANAVASQTQTLFIRDLATGSKIFFKKYIVRQLGVTFLIALVCWGLILGVTGIFWRSFVLGGVIGLATTSAILTATVLALLIPEMLRFFNLDPAVGSGPFATVIQDFLSITIYFSIASALL